MSLCPGDVDGSPVVTFGSKEVGDVAPVTTGERTGHFDTERKLPVKRREHGLAVDAKIDRNSLF